MKNFFLMLLFAGLIWGCSNSTPNETNGNSAEESTTSAGQSVVKDDVSAKNVVQIAIGSKDHSTLVAAVKAAQLVDVLSNTGPFTVFAPTNDAFAKLPAGTVDDLLKPENLEKLQDILQYHVSVGVYQAASFMDGQTLGQVNGGNIKIGVKDGVVTVNGTAKVIASIPASNGIIHVVDGVLLEKK